MDRLAERLEHSRNEPRTVLIPSNFRHMPVSAMVKDDASDINKLIPAFKHEDGDAFPNMSHCGCVMTCCQIASQKGWTSTETDQYTPFLRAYTFFQNLVLGIQHLLDDDYNQAR